MYTLRSVSKRPSSVPGDVCTVYHNFEVVFNQYLSNFSSGVHSIAYAFPKVKIVTTAVDPETNDSYHIIPGIGELC